MIYKIEIDFDTDLVADTSGEAVDIIRKNINFVLGKPDHLRIKVYNEKKELENISVFYKMKEEGDEIK